MPGNQENSVRAAVNVLDGFSTSAFFDVLVAGSVNPATAVAGQSVFLLQLDTGTNDALDPANIVGITGMANFDVQVLSLDGGTNNAIPTRCARRCARTPTTSSSARCATSRRSASR